METTMEHITTAQRLMHELAKMVRDEQNCEMPDADWTFGIIRIASACEHLPRDLAVLVQMEIAYAREVCPKGGKHGY